LPTQQEVLLWFSLLGYQMMLDLELSALQADNRGEAISTIPRFPLTAESNSKKVSSRYLLFFTKKHQL
jgi:hypothetical protein